MMKIVIKILIPVILLISQFVNSQEIPNPYSDPSWELVPLLSDEFNTGTTFDPLKWTWNQSHFINGSFCLKNDLDHIAIVSEGGESFIRLSARKNTYLTTCTNWSGTETLTTNYTSGKLIGKHEKEFGYFEVKFKLSTPPTHPYSHEGLSANAWLWRSWVPYNGIWSEIDLAEIDTSDYRHTCNVIFDPNEDDDIESQENMRCPTDDFCTPLAPTDFILNPGWHIYTAVWKSTGIEMYVDGNFINSTTLGIPGMEPLNWILGPASGENQFSTFINSYTSFPFNMDIDYVRTYNLKKDCDIINSCSYNVNSYDHQVKKSIKFGGMYCNTSVSVGTPIYMKAEDFIEITAGFTVPLGAEFAAEIYSCK